MDPIIWIFPHKWLIIGKQIASNAYLKTKVMAYHFERKDTREFFCLCRFSHHTNDNIWKWNDQRLFSLCDSTIVFEDINSIYCNFTIQNYKSYDLFCNQMWTHFDFWYIINVSKTIKQSKTLKEWLVP